MSNAQSSPIISVERLRSEDGIDGTKDLATMGKSGGSNSIPRENGSKFDGFGTPILCEWPAEDFFPSNFIHFRSC